MTLLSSEDRTAILELIANYAYMWDGKDAEGYSGLFTEDANWELYFEGESTPEQLTAITGPITRHRRCELCRAFSQACRRATTKAAPSSPRSRQNWPKEKRCSLVTHQRAGEETPRLILVASTKIRS